MGANGLEKTERNVIIYDMYTTRDNMSYAKIAKEFGISRNRLVKSLE